MEQNRSGRINGAAQADLPVARNEDVEYSRELADADDMQAQSRAEAADRRASTVADKRAVAENQSECGGL